MGYLLVFDRVHARRSFDKILGECSKDLFPAFESSRADYSLSLTSMDHWTLVLIQGLHVRTEEGLEVFGVGVSEGVRDYLPLDRTVSLLLEKDVLVILPWGFGKWWFKRGKTMRACLSQELSSNVFLGDQKGRPSCFAAPLLFKQNKDRWILPGSDPWPFPSHVSRVADFGFVLTGSVSLNAPAQSLKQLLLSLQRQPQTFGHRDGPARFLFNQSRLYLKHRREATPT